MAPTNPQAFQFRDRFYEIPVPPWLRTGNAEKYMYVLETCRDLLCEKAYEAMTIRLPGVGDPSNIPYLAFDRNLIQGPKESNESFTQRLTESFEAWGECGSALAVIGQLQAYMQNLQPGVDPTLPAITIVGNPSTLTEPQQINTWNQVYQGTPIGAPPTRTALFPVSFIWDNLDLMWRNWLILPMALVAVPGLSGSAGATSTAGASACFTSPGQNVNGVWVPATSGTPVNSPWLTLTGLTGLTSTQASTQVGQWITLTGSSHSGNNGCFQIVNVLSTTSCVIANPQGVASDAGPLTWSIGQYPWIGPGPAWGQVGYIWGQGELTVPYTTSTSLLGTFHVTTGSATVTTTVPQAEFLQSFNAITFGSQPGVAYPIYNVAGTTLTLATPYTGSSNAATTGQLVTLDTGSNPPASGVWQATTPIGSTTAPSISWGLNRSSGTIGTIRLIVKTWKSAETYYQNIIIAFDCGNGAPGTAYSPNSTPGSGNPDGTFGPIGKNVGGVWVPTRIISGNPLTPYLWDCYCQGTGTYQQCSIENVT